MSYCEVVRGSSEIRRNMITPVVDGMAYNRHDELKLLADKCLRCVLCIPMQLSSAGYSFLVKSHINKCEIHVMIKLFPNTSITLEQIHIFKISILAELILLAIDPSSPTQNSR